MGAMYRACLSCHRLVPATMNRHPECQREWDRARQARRGNRYDREHRNRAGAAIAEEPWCHWPGCRRTDDLTADHDVRGGPYRVLCRSHNSERANRMRARWGGGSAP